MPHRVAWSELSAWYVVRMGTLQSSVTRLIITYYIASERPTPVWRAAEASGRRDASETSERYVLKPLRITLIPLLL